LRVSLLVSNGKTNLLTFHNTFGSFGHVQVVGATAIQIKGLEIISFTIFGFRIKLLIRRLSLEKPNLRGFYGCEKEHLGSALENGMTVVQRKEEAKWHQ
jgi:hypothetical protein